MAKDTMESLLKILGDRSKEISEEIKMISKSVDGIAKSLAIGGIPTVEAGVAGVTVMEGGRPEMLVRNAIGRALGVGVSFFPRGVSEFQKRLAAVYPVIEGKVVEEPQEVVPGVMPMDFELKGQLPTRQTSLLHETKLVVNDALRILDSLQPIRSDADEDRVRALKSLVRAGLSSLLDESGRVDRPRKPKVVEVLGHLRGEGDTIGGHLAALQRELGIDFSDTLDIGSMPDGITTTEEAQSAAEFDLLMRYAEILKKRFEEFFNALRDPRDGSFTGRLAFVSLLLPLVAESVREVEVAMNRFGLGAEERRTVFILEQTTDSGSLISLDGIFSWIKNFALQEGPNLIAQGGRLGLIMVVDVADRLRDLVNQILNPSQPPMPPHPTLDEPLVKDGLAQLAAALDGFSSPSYNGEQGMM